MPANPFESAFGIPLPRCCSAGDCCKGVSPSTPTRKLRQRAAEGDEFARNFFSIMTPYASHEDARRVVPGIVEKTLVAARQSPEFENNEADVVFYRCRFLQRDNRCGVHEDRPQFCRDYPDSPFVVMAPDCAYLPWAAACKKQYAALTSNLEALKRLQDSLQGASGGGLSAHALDPELLAALENASCDALSELEMENLSLTLSLTPLYLASPLATIWL
ncbi:MAG: YkgJ family cysteine cluster protein [Vampirovibrionales bacterium]|nr:YkgJ family cysteine cluster protein [Vampirovibrionales bacterium]